MAAASARRVAGLLASVAFSSGPLCQLLSASLETSAESIFGFDVELLNRPREDFLKLRLRDFSAPVLLSPSLHLASNLL